MLHLELIAHMDAGDRALWTRPQDERPLSPLGQRQAQRMADELCVEPIDAIFSSPALRCIQTVEPMAVMFGLSAVALEELRDTESFAEPEGWQGSRAALPNVVGAAYAAGRGFAAVSLIRQAVPDGRVLVCTHGDLLPALLAFLRGAEGLDFPRPHEQRGGWETLMIEGDHIEVYQHALIPHFPS